MLCSLGARHSCREVASNFSRYINPMRQLATLRNSANEAWFAAPIMYWHKKVFAPQLNLPPNADAPAGRRVAPR